MKKVIQRKLIEEYYNHFPLTDFFGFDIVPYVSIVQFESDEAIMCEGTAPTHLYYLIDGRAKLYLSHKNGRVSLINFLNAPCFIGEMELIGAQSVSNGIIAITACTCYAIRISDCKYQVLNDVKFLSHLCLFLGEKAIGNTYNYSQNQAYPLDVRLANFVLMTSHNGYYLEKHTEVSEFLGVTYRHLLYVLANFVKSGILQKTYKGYYIADLVALQKVAYLETGEIE